MDAAPFPGESSKVIIGELTVRVNLELRIHASYGDDQLVRLWFPVPPPSRATRQTFSYIMDLAKQKEGWPLEWHMGILDIDRKAVLPNLETSSAFQDGVKQQAATYMEMWRQLRAELEDMP